VFVLREILKIGRDIREGKRALPYDRAVIRHVYLDDPLEVANLPPFRTDGQKGCSAFPSKPALELRGMKGETPAND